MRATLGFDEAHRASLQLDELKVALAEEADDTLDEKAASARFEALTEIERSEIDLLKEIDTVEEKKQVRPRPLSAS